MECWWHGCDQADEIISTGESIPHGWRHPPLPATATVGRNPTSGAVVYYSLKSKPTSDVVLEFLDASASQFKSFTGKPAKATAAAGQPSPAASPSPRFNPLHNQRPRLRPKPRRASEEPQAGGEEPEGLALRGDLP